MIELGELGASRRGLETALVLSVLEQEPFRCPVDRPPSPTGQALIDVAAEVSSARTANSAGEWSFEPTEVSDGGEYRFDLSGYGRENHVVSVSPVLRILASILSRTGTESVVRVRGGTHLASGPPYQYLDEVYAPMLRQMGYGLELELTSWGFPPEGDGLVEMRLGGSDPRGERAVQLTDRGSLRRLKGVSAVGNLSPDILRRQTREANDRLERAGYERVVQSEPVESRSPGTVLHLAAEYENVRAGFYAYGRKGKPAEEVAREAVDSFLEYEESSEPVQTDLAERLLVPLMIMEGASAIRTSDPAQIRTALPVARHFRDEVPSVQKAG